MSRGMGKFFLLLFTVLAILLAITGNASAQPEFWLFGGAMCGIVAIIWIIIILVAIWVYRDANSRGMSGVLWLIVVLVAGIIGIIIYLVIRRDNPVGSYPPPGYPPPGYPPPGYPPPPPGGYPPPR